MRGKIPVSIFLVLLFPLSILSLREVEKTPEYQAKAVFIERITRFIDWPESSKVADTSRPFVFGIIGDPPLKTWAEKIYQHENIKIKNKSVEIRYLKTPGEVIGCDLLFIARSVAGQLPQILSITENKPILTIGDTEGFAENGVHINLLIKGGNVKYEINQMAFMRSSLVLQYSLLKFASKIHEPLRKVR